MLQSDSLIFIMKKTSKIYIFFITLFFVVLGLVVWQFKPLNFLRAMIFTGASHDVVINEIMWMGTDGTVGGGDADDMFLELRNMTTTVIDFSVNPFVIEKDTGSGFATMVTINNGILPSEGYFVISKLSALNSRVASSDFVDSSLSLESSAVSYRLRDDSYNLLDEVDDGSGAPLAGVFNSGSVYTSMERNSDPGIGTVEGSWHDAYSSGGFDSVSLEYGSPGQENSPVIPVLTGYTASSDPALNSGIGEVDIEFTVSGNQDLPGLVFEVEEREAAGVFANIDSQIVLDTSSFPLFRFTRTNLSDVTVYEYRIRAKNIDTLVSDYSSIQGVQTLDRTSPNYISIHLSYIQSALDANFDVTTDEVTTTTYQFNTIPGDCSLPLANLYDSILDQIIFPSEGLHHVYVCSQDSEGNYGPPEDVSVTVDIPPEITIQNISHGSIINTNAFTLETSIYENLTLRSPSYRIDGASVPNCRNLLGQPRNLGSAFTVLGTAPNFTTSNAVSGLTDGQHTIWACAGGDVLYNQVSTPASSTFTVDTVAPYFTNLVYPLVTTTNAITISFDVGDLTSGVDLDTLEIEINGNVYDTTEIVCMTPPVANVYSCSFQTTLPTAGTYPFTIRSDDMATNYYQEVQSITANISSPSGGSGGGGGGSSSKNSGDTRRVSNEPSSSQPVSSSEVVVSATQIYRDVSSKSPYFGAVQNLTARAIITGHEDNTFRAYDNLTRAEACVVMVRAKGLSIKEISDYPESIRGLYNDVDSHPLAAYILAATEAQLVHGRQELSNPLPVVPFDPDAPVSKAELGKMAVETILPELAHTPVTTSVPSDINDTGFWWVKDYYYGALVKIKAFDPALKKFDPNTYVQRGQLADYFWKAIQEDEK